MEDLQSPFYRRMRVFIPGILLLNALLFTGARFVPAGIFPPPVSSRTDLKINAVDFKSIEMLPPNPKKKKPPFLTLEERFKVARVIDSAA